MLWQVSDVMLIICNIFVVLGIVLHLKLKLKEGQYF